MKKIRESISNFFESHNVLTAILIMIGIGCFLHFSGIAAWDHKFVDDFWKAKHF